jgi:hypothetical protein
MASLELRQSGDRGGFGVAPRSGDGLEPGDVEGDAVGTGDGPPGRLACGSGAANDAPGGCVGSVSEHAATNSTHAAIAMVRRRKRRDDPT